MKKIMCETCKLQMVPDRSVCYTSNPPQYDYKCFKCGQVKLVADDLPLEGEALFRKINNLDEGITQLNERKSVWLSETMDGMGTENSIFLED